MITRAEVIALGITLPFLDFLFVALRLYVKRRKTKTLSIDDYLITVTLVFHPNNRLRMSHELC